MSTRPTLSIVTIREPRPGISGIMWTTTIVFLGHKRSQPVWAQPDEQASGDHDEAHDDDQHEHEYEEGDGEEEKR